MPMPPIRLTLLMGLLGFVAYLPAQSPSVKSVPASNIRPCDIYGRAHTPCVAAFSTTRVLFATSTGPLYQVTRQSDKTSRNIGVLSDGYANAATQDSFCDKTTCTITRIYDQSPRHNDLAVAPPGGAAHGRGPGGDDLPAIANALPVTAHGHKVYGIYISAGMGYRNNKTSGIAVNGQPEGVYMVTSGIHANGGCCFDFGNAETNSRDNGNGHMDAISLMCGNPCNPHVGLDMENGIYPDLPVTTGLPFVTALGANDGQKKYQVYWGNAQLGGLATTGLLPLPAKGYTPMRQEGAILLGIGGDNSNASIGSFFEGVMTAGVPSSATMNAVQANVVLVGYAAP
jgi:Alpha-L-arabinofuranosidase B, catalytic